MAAAALGQEIRLFEVDEAERMLPLLRVIAKGMMDDFAERRERLAGGADPDDPDVAALTEKLSDAAAELAELGVEPKGVDAGLIDFPAQREGEIVYLCWRYGEERIGHWHALDAGFAGRRPLDRD